MPKLILPAILAITLLASCTQPAQPAATDSTSGQPAAKTETPAATTTATPVTTNTSAVNLCDLLPMAEVSTLAGVTFTKIEHKVSNKENPHITDCFYSNEEGQSVGIIANYDQPEGLSAKDQYQQLLDYLKEQESESPSEKISGVGDEAFIPTTGMLTQINALKGNVWLTLSIYTGSKTGDKEQAIAIAKRAFEVL